MHRKLLGIAIVALLPFASAHAAQGCPQVKQSVDNNVDLKTAMEDAVRNNQCTPAEAASAGAALAKTGAEHQIVSAFRDYYNIGEQVAGRSGGYSLTGGFSFGSTSGGGQGSGE